MGKMNNTSVERAIAANKKHIEEYVMDVAKGTKKVKEKFHKNAVKERNKYVEKQLKIFNNYKRQIYRVMKDNFNRMEPSNKKDKYKNDLEELVNLEAVILFTREHISDSYKLGFCKLINLIKEDGEILLDDINDVINVYYNKFLEMGISLTLTDFSYSMFTMDYMEMFFKSKNTLHFKETMRVKFEKLYFECPDFLKHLKLNLWYLLNKYEKEIGVFVNKRKEELLVQHNVNNNNIFEIYNDMRRLYEEEQKSDLFDIVENFLEGTRNISDYLESSLVRGSCLDKYVFNGNFFEISHYEQTIFYDNMVQLQYDLLGLKDYYRYSFIIEDIRKRYGKVSENKGAYANKLKEIATEEKNRTKIFGEYLRATGVGFLAKRNPVKIDSVKLKMNDQIIKLNQLYKELRDLEISVKIEKTISDVSSLDDLLLAGYSSYYYLEEMFNNHFKEDSDYSLNSELERFFKFVFGPNNLFLRKLNGLSNIDVCDVICDKYRMLGINLTKEMLSSENIDVCISDVDFISLIHRVNNSKLGFNDIKFMCDFNKFEKVDLDDVEIL